MKPILIAAFLTLICPVPFAEATEEEPAVEAPVAAKDASRIPAPAPSPRISATATPVTRPDAPSLEEAPRPSGWTPRLFSRPPPI